MSFNANFFPHPLHNTSGIRKVQSPAGHGDARVCRSGELLQAGGCFFNPRGCKFFPVPIQVRLGATGWSSASDRTAVHLPSVEIGIHPELKLKCTTLPKRPCWWCIGFRHRSFTQAAPPLGSCKLYSEHVICLSDSELRSHFTRRDAPEVMIWPALSPR